MSNVNKEFVKRWVYALRSGNYPQGFNGLHRYKDDIGNQYCPVGVAAILLWADGKITRKRETNVGVVVYSYDDSTIMLSSKVIREHIGELPENFMWEIAKLNDGHRKPFPEIADYIEKKLLGEEKNQVEANNLFITSDNVIRINVVATIEPEEVKKFANWLNEIAEQALSNIENNKPWKKAPVGSIAKVGANKHLAQKVSGGYWSYVKDDQYVVDANLEDQFILLKEDV